MILGEIFSRFIEKSPVSVMVVGMVERALSSKWINKIFDLTSVYQYTRDLMFSKVFDLLSYAVFGIYPSVHAAYQAHNEEIDVSIKSVYNKLDGVEIETSRALVRSNAEELCSIIVEMGASLSPLLPGFRIKILDGNCIESSEHRLKELRAVGGGALPGKSLVVLDPSLMLVLDVFPCEDGHAQERSLLDDVLKSIEAFDLWIADRNFCTRHFLFGIAESGGFFNIRQHGQFPFEELEAMREVGRSETGMIYEQRIRIEDEKGKSFTIRRVKIELDEPTGDGDWEIFVLTNLPTEVADALTVAALYRRRWTLEGVFQELEKHFNSEINTLAYPKAALFAFCIALIAYNLLSVVKAALRAVHGEEKIEKEVSGYYLANEIAGTYRGMMIAIPEEEWKVFREFSTPQIAKLLIQLAENVKLSKFKKHPRGPKKPPPKRDKSQPHVSTARLIANRKPRAPNS